MPITVAFLRAKIARRCGTWSALADVDEAIGYALFTLQIGIADPTAIADTDVQSVQSTQLPQLFDVAEWRVLESVLNNLDTELLKSVGIETSVEKAQAALRPRVTRLCEFVSKAYGIGQSVLALGTLKLDIDQHHGDQGNYTDEWNWWGAGP